MADDNRSGESIPDQDPASDEARRPRRPRPKHEFPESQAAKLWKAFGNPDERINEMPGGMVNTAGGRPKEVTWRDAFSWEVLSKDGPAFYKTPCARDSLLVGIGSGGAIGGVRFILKGLSSMLVTTNYAVGAFAVSATGMYYWCQSKRKEEAKGMVAAMAGMKMLHEKRAREKAVEEAAAKAAELKTEEEKKRNKSWYKVW